MNVCFELDSTTTNDCHLLEEIHIHVIVNISAGHYVSYSDFFFFIPRSYCCKRISTVKFKCLF
jgi:hypothetical protein